MSKEHWDAAALAVDALIERGWIDELQRYNSGQVVREILRRPNLLAARPATATATELAKELAEAIDFTAGPPEARELFEKILSRHMAAAVPTGGVMGLRAELVRYRDATYCEGIRIAQTTPCLGWEAKAATGKYGEAEHQAHKECNEAFGAYHGACQAIRLLDEAIAAAPHSEGEKP